MLQPPSPPSLPPTPLDNATDAIVAAVTTYVSSTVAASVGLSVAASVTTSVATSVAASVGAAAAGAGAGAGAAGATGGASGGGGGGGGGGVMPLVLGVQRFSCSGGLAVDKSEMQSGVSGSLGLMSGEAEILTPARAKSLIAGRNPFARRRLNEDEAAASTLAPECISLINLLLTGCLAIVLTVLLQLILVLLWRKLVNRRYYKWTRRVVPDHEQDQDPATPQSKTRVPPKFIPFPRSLVWPTPLVFICCIFLTGLTRASVRVLATIEPAAWGSFTEWREHVTGCEVAAIATLTVLATLVLCTMLDVWIFYRRHGSKVHWKRSARAASPREISDPLMRLYANTRLLLVSTGLHAKRRASEKLLLRPTPRRSTTLTVPVGLPACPAQHDRKSGQALETVDDSFLEDRPSLLKRRTGLEAESMGAHSFVKTASDEDGLVDTPSGEDDETSAVPLPPGAFTTTSIQRFTSLSPRSRQGYRSVSPPQKPSQTLRTTSFCEVLPNAGQSAPPSPPPSSTAVETVTCSTVTTVTTVTCSRRVTFNGDQNTSRRRSTFVESRAAAAQLLATRRGGLRDRKSGAFAVPEADTAEPARTERLLKRPFALRRARTGDAFQAHEGFLFFRVNGSSRIGVIYRLLVVFANVTFGALSGLAPLLPPGSLVAGVQTGVVFGLQLLMAGVCFIWAPDADRIISLFAGTQFFLEAVSTGFLLSASLLPLAGLPTGADALDADFSVSIGLWDWPFLLRLGAFWVGLIALAVPILQMVEQRCMTPSILVVRNRGGSALALCAAAYMLVSSVPRMIMRLCETAAGLEDVEEGGGGGIDGVTADAGDEAAANAGSDAEVEVGLSGEAVLTAAHNISKLGARGLAAKEVTATNVERSPDAPGCVRTTSNRASMAARASGADAMTGDGDDMDDAGVDP